jgi:hypothetical protein
MSNCSGGNLVRASDAAARFVMPFEVNHVVSCRRRRLPLYPRYRTFLGVAADGRNGPLTVIFRVAVIQANWASGMRISVLDQPLNGLDFKYLLRNIF